MQGKCICFCCENKSFAESLNIVLLFRQHVYIFDYDSFKWHVNIFVNIFINRNIYNIII